MAANLTPGKYALVQRDDYIELVKRSVTAPKVRPLLTGKQQRRANDQIDNTFFIDVGIEERTMAPKEVTEGGTANTSV